ncbi:hypothetical protein VNI00_018807 [Paramarasmius palmivorus]|uniref:Uncharacterized protein n=1 Tax=Paramarasmius palmivorus TaxID=297713 RepID=A0AAW0ATM8_9AGAR
MAQDDPSGPIPGKAIHSKPPVNPPGHAPDTYTLTQHNPDKVSRTTVEDLNGWVVVTMTTIYRRHPEADVTHVSRGTSPGAIPENTEGPLAGSLSGLLNQQVDSMEPSLHGHVFASLATPLAPPAQYSTQIPHPNAITLRPSMEMLLRYYVVFCG